MFNAIILALAELVQSTLLGSKFGGMTAPEFGQGTTVGGDSKVHHGTEGNNHSKVSSDSSHDWIELTAT